LPNGWDSSSIRELFIINPRNDVNDDTLVSFVPMALIDDGFSNYFTYHEHSWRELKSKFTHFQDGDVGLAKITPCLENRKSVVFSGLMNGVGAGTTELHIFRPILAGCILPAYLLWFFKSEQFISNCIAAFSGAVGQQRVGKDYVANMTFPLPPLEEQRRIVTAIDMAFEQLDEIVENIN
jgi:Restriction endonuclease S subunits